MRAALSSLSPEAVPKLNLGCGRDIRPKEEGWLNLDGFVEDPRVLRWNLEDLPLPLPSNTFGVVYARHVMEHVRHVPSFGITKRVVRLVSSERADSKEVESLLALAAEDPFHLLLKEIHRILVPKGRFVVVSPHHLYSEKWSSSGHVRAVMTYAFESLAQETGVVFSLAWKSVTSWQPVVGRSFLAMGNPPLGILKHLSIRAPFLAPLFCEPEEATYEFVKEESANQPR